MTQPALDPVNQMNYLDSKSYDSDSTNEEGTIEEYTSTKEANYTRNEKW